MKPGSAPARVFCSMVGAGLLLSACAERGPPAVTFVEDRAGLLTDSEESDITTWHTALLAQCDIDYRVLTVSGSEDLSGLTVRHFEKTGVGSVSRTGRGLLLVVDATGERVRLEVGRELENVFVDSFVAFIEREQMAPFFAAGRVGDGIVATTELVAGRAEQALAAAALDGHESPGSSAGAGAESQAPIRSGYDRPRARIATDSSARAEPLDSVAVYLAAMAAYNASPDLDVYTSETRELMAGHVVTRGQMDNLVRTYQDCPGPRVRERGDFAVVDHPGDLGKCSPWFLSRGPDGLWRLDMVTMQRAIRFDTRNRWRIAAQQALGEYAFAFSDRPPPTDPPAMSELAP